MQTEKKRNTPLYHQHQGNGTYYLATSLKRKTLIYSNLCYLTIILLSIANIIYYIISVYSSVCEVFAAKLKKGSGSAMHVFNSEAGLLCHDCMYVCIYMVVVHNRDRLCLLPKS